LRIGNHNNGQNNKKNNKAPVLIASSSIKSRFQYVYNVFHLPSFIPSKGGSRAIKFGNYYSTFPLSFWVDYFFSAIRSLALRALI
jgi:hypothetical protein